MRFGKFILFLWFLLFTSIIYSQTQKVKSKDGVEIAFTENGKGDPAMVFIHGWSCDKSYWNEQVKRFAKLFKVITIDLGGHGESGLNRRNWTVEAFSQDVAAVVNHLKLKNFILVGHSMGGSVIIEAAKLLKGKALGLVGVDTYQNFEDDWTIEQKEEFLKPFEKDFIGTTKEFVKKMFPPSSDSVLVKRIAEDMSQAPPKVAISAMRNLLFYNPIPTLKEIKLPIVSINSDMYPLAIDENKKIIGSYTVKIIEDVGHFIMLEKINQFNSYLYEAADELTTMNE